MEDAHRQMSSHCGPGNYDVISEGEAVVGSETVQDQATAVRDDRRGGATARSQTVRQSRVARRVRLPWRGRASTCTSGCLPTTATTCAQRGAILI